jgi:hypothetical protein
MNPNLNRSSKKSLSWNNQYEKFYWDKGYSIGNIKSRTGGKKTTVVQSLPLAAQASLYLLLILMGLFALLVFGWQVNILRGKAMKNPDGSTDDWHEQKTHYGIAVADVFLACPACFLGILLVFINPRWGYYLSTMVSFWFVWTNIMTTSTSLHFEKLKLNLNW